MSDCIRKGSLGRADTPGYSFQRVSGLDAIGGTPVARLAARHTRADFSGAEIGVNGPLHAQ